MYCALMDFTDALNPAFARHHDLKREYSVSMISFHERLSALLQATPSCTFPKTVSSATPATKDSARSSFSRYASADFSSHVSQT